MLTKEQAVVLANTGWWTKIPSAEAALFQLFEERLCMPFSEFHAGVEKLLGRGVFTHEFAYCDKPGGLRDEALGKADRPTLQQILDLVPVEKRVTVLVDDDAR